MSGKIALRVAASHAQMELVEQAIDKMARREQWPDDVIYKVKLVVEEIGLNIIDHGYGRDDSKEMEFRLNSEDGALTIEFIDEAKPFDPLSETPDPDISSGIGERPIGGLGVYLVQEMMDEVKYTRDSNRNRLTMVMRLPS